MLLSIDPWSMCQLYMFYSKFYVEIFLRRKLRFFFYILCVGGGDGGGGCLLGGGDKLGGLRGGALPASS